MISITKAQVPNYLHDSDFYRSLEEEGGDILIPKDCFKTDIFFYRPNDLRDLLSTLRYWIVTAIPAEFVRFVIFNKIDDSDEVFAEFEGELLYLSFLRKLSNYAFSSDHKIGTNKFALYLETLGGAQPIDALDGCTKLCCFQCGYYGGETWNTQTCKLAAEFGDMPMLRWLHEHGCPWDARTCVAAAQEGHLECLKYAHENLCPWDLTVCSAAAIGKHVHCLRYAHENCCPWDVQTCIAAVHADSQDCLMYAQEKGCPWGPGICAAAAVNGDLALLQRLHDGGCPWDSKTCSSAALGNHLNCLQYAHENGCPWDSETCTYSSNITIMHYAHTHGCPWDAHTSEIAASRSVALLQYVHENGCPWDKTTCVNASFQGKIGALTYAHENGCPWDEEVTSSAAQYGHLTTLRYAHENGCPWDEEVCSGAAQIGELACLKYANENGCPWDVKTCSNAASSLFHNGLPCLQYAHKQGCPWDATTCSRAAAKGHLDCLQYAHKNGCPWDSNTCTAAVESGHLNCLKYAYRNGCPLDGALYQYFDAAISRKCIDYAKLHKCYPRLGCSPTILAEAPTTKVAHLNAEYCVYEFDQMQCLESYCNSGNANSFHDVHFLSLVAPLVHVLVPAGTPADFMQHPFTVEVITYHPQQQSGLVGDVKAYVLFPADRPQQTSPALLPTPLAITTAALAPRPGVDADDSQAEAAEVLPFAITSLADNVLPLNAPAREIPSDSLSKRPGSLDDVPVQMSVVTATATVEEETKLPGLQNADAPATAAAHRRCSDQSSQPPLQISCA